VEYYTTLYLLSGWQVIRDQRIWTL